MRPPKTTSLKGMKKWAAPEKTLVRLLLKTLSNSGIRVMKIAPKMDPSTLPMPPTMTMARYCTDRWKGKCYGVTMRMKPTHRATAMPA